MTDLRENLLLGRIAAWNHACLNAGTESVHARKLWKSIRADIEAVESFVRGLPPVPADHAPVPGPMRCTCPISWHRTYK